MMDNFLTNGDQPANPVVETDNCINIVTGLTKREAFAMAAMQGMSSHPDFYNMSESFADTIVIDCVKFADALLKELEK